MASPTVTAAVAAVNLGMDGFYDAICQILCTGPHVWYGWQASYRTKFLAFEGYNATSTCGCRELRLKPRLIGSFPWLIERVRMFEKLCDFKPPQITSVDSNCPLCRLLHSSVPQKGPNQGIPSLTRYRMGEGVTLSGNKADIWGFEADLEGARLILPMGSDAHLIDRKPDGYLRPLRGKRADRELMSAWLHECIDSHIHCQDREKLALASVQGPRRLINTKTMTVNLAQPGARYFALSYVWGGVAQPHVPGLGQLTTESDSCSLVNVVLPKVILDAIKLTNDLGEAFLWVDALCIDQDDLSDKAEEISRMNFVYLGALMTIVAMDGSDANAGLSGVDDYPTPRAARVEIVEGVAMSIARPSLAEAYGASSWNRRSWCMQEHLFSRRLLFFGPEQVYFSCLSRAFAEDRHEVQGGPYNLHDHPGRTLLQPPRGEVLWMSVLWKLFVELYSKRQLSVETDRYPAFQGILNHQKEAWGLHFAEASPLEFLPLALNWWHGTERGEPLDTIPRRIQGRPSWTWTGWSGAVCFPTYERYQSMITSVKVRSGSEWTTHNYDRRGQLNGYDVVESEQKSIAFHPAAVESARVAFSAACVEATGLDDGVRESYLSLQDERGRRVGGVTKSINVHVPSGGIRCQCILIGVSWQAIGFFENIESYIGSTASERIYGTVVSDMLTPVDARYGQRFDNPRRAIRGGGFEIYPPSKDPLIKRVDWYAPAMLITMYTLIPLLALLLVVVELSVTMIVVGLMGPILVFMAVMYGCYFAILRPFWLRSKRWRVAHVLWVEEVEGGVYERNGIGEMRYSAFVKLKPRDMEIKLV